MTVPLLIGDEITAAGFRLAGVRIRSPQDDELMRVLSWAQSNSSLIFITAEYVTKLTMDQQNSLLSQEHPPVVVIPDIRSNTPVEDLATQLREQLGVLE